MHNSIKNNKMGIWIKLAPAFVLSILFLVELILILLRNNMQFCYTLDDAYIHLAMAENIADGHYGVNVGEFSAPASSIIWPFLLAPFGRSSVLHFIPLFFNYAAALGTILILGRIITLILESCKNRLKALTISFIVILSIPAMNLIGLVFTGMEHSLQILISILLVYGVLLERHNRTIPWFLIFALIFGPLLRYENLALSVPVLFYLVSWRHKKTFFTCGIIIISLLVGFSIFLNSMGLGLFPSSVIVKSDPVALGGSAASLIGNFLRNVLWYRQGALLFVIFLWFIYTGFNSRFKQKDRTLAKWITAGVLLHLVIGKFGEYHRYEIYIWSFSLIMILSYYRDGFVHLLQRKPFYSVIISLCIFVGVTCTPYINVMLTTPQASHNIYSQQYQMYRFVVEYMPVNVAVNDLGRVSFQNDNYVMDLWGLASKEALDFRKQKADPEWMNKLAEKQNVEFAMIYKRWFPTVPDNWIPIGVLYLDQKRITPAFHNVTFYALNEEIYIRAKDLLPDYEKTLPEGARFKEKEK
jgi:hypothetical protein